MPPQYSDGAVSHWKRAPPPDQLLPDQLPPLPGARVASGAPPPTVLSKSGLQAAVESDRTPLAAAAAAAAAAQGQRCRRRAGPGRAGLFKSGPYGDPGGPTARVFVGEEREPHVRVGIRVGR